MSKKVKVIEVVATKLDPNATHLIVFKEHQISKEEMYRIHSDLVIRGIDVVGTYAPDPETALKVYQIPKVKK
jgi:hypothetical protein